MSRTDHNRDGYLLAQAAPGLHAVMQALLQKRCVFFVGLPASGKSLMVHQLAHLAVSQARSVGLLQWDVARPAFEAAPAGLAYPMVDGITRPLIRRAAGLWARGAVARWHEVHGSPADLLIGEVPLIGSRFVELVRPDADAAEDFLAGEGCRFVIVTASNEVRGYIESERVRRFASPANQGEAEDAPPSVLHESWQEIERLAGVLGLDAVSPVTGYDADLHTRVYRHLLRYRGTEVVEVDRVLPVGSLSVYDQTVGIEGLRPTPAEAERYIRAAEAEWRDGTGAARVERWWEY